MANLSITQLPVATALTGNEQLPLVQNGVTKQASVSQIANVVIPGKFITNVAFDNANYMIIIYYSDGSTQEIGPVPGYESAYISGGDLYLVDTNGVPYNLGNVIGPQGPVGPQGPTGPQGPKGDKGDTGDAATIAVGTTTTVSPSTPASVTNSGTSSAAVFNFDIPKGDTGATGPSGTAATITVGTTTTVSPSTPAAVTNSGTSSAAIFNFDIPQGQTGTAATIAVGTTSTLSPGSPATVSNSGTSSAAVFNFGIPKGDTGATGPTGPAGPGVPTGGSTGQVLAKASSTDYDTQWISLTGLSYQGTWNASTNTPTLTSSVGTQGFYYVVSVSGSTNLNGITDWVAGDWAVFNGSVWQKIDNTESVTSVNGYTGIVVLGYADVGAPSTTGTGATGTWNIDITGNAATVTNGVYTTGSYADPIWITSLAGSKVFNIPNSSLNNSSITINGSTISLGGSATITAVNPFALTIGTGLSGTSYNGGSAVTIANTGVLSAIAGTGISVSGATGNVTITNTAPDQIVSLTGAGTTTVTGTYPNFTITSNDAYTGTVTSVGTGTGLTGGPITTTGTINFSNANVAAWAATPSSANLAAAMTDETGSGSLVFANSPTLSSPLIDNANPYISFGDGTAVTLAAGRMWYNGTTGSWNLGMGGGNITQQVGEELFVYGKATSAVNDSPLQIIYHTGTVGASGVITFAPTIAGITDVNAIIGVATEPIALNAFGRVTAFGVIHGINTTGSAFGETWANDDVIWYNPVTGNPTNIKPVAPNMKVQVGIVINAGSGGSGSFQVLLQAGTQLGGTDSNVQITSVTNGNILSYDGTNSYWRNTDLTAGTGISISKSATGVLTVTNTSPSSGGTVTSVSGTGTVSGITLSGTVTTSGSLTLGGTLDLSSPPAIGGTTPNLITGTTITATKYVGISGGTF